MLLVSRRQVWESMGVLGVVTVGIAARATELGYGFDGDEMFSVKLASAGFGQVIEASLRDQPHPPLHNILLYVWMRAFGTSPDSARALSLVCSAVFLVGAYYLLRRFVPVVHALAMTSVLAVSPYFVYFGQQARGYSLLACMSVASLLTFFRLAENVAVPGRLAVWAVTCALLPYSEYFGMLIVLLEVAYALAVLPNGLRIAAVGLLSAGFVAPWLLFAIGRAVARGLDPLPQITWMGPPTVSNLAWFYLDLFGEQWRVRWLCLLLAVPFVAYVWRAFKSRSIPPEQGLLAAVAIGVPITVFVASVLGPKPVFAERQLIGSAAAFVVVLAVAVTSLPRRLAVAAELGLIVWTVASLPHAFPHNTKPPWQDIAASLDRDFASRSIVAAEPWVSLPLQFYRVGSTRSWDDLSEAERRQPILYVCRPLNCLKAPKALLESPWTLVRDWRWGLAGASDEATARRRVLLYEIAEQREGRPIPSQATLPDKVAAR
jgi:hypothetical protein